MVKKATGRTNEEWLIALEGGAGFDEALTDLRAILVRGLRFSLMNRIHTDLDQIVEDFVQDALLKILDKMHTFRGESKFTTWAQKVAVRVALSELRRQRWRDVSFEKITEREDGSIFTPTEFSDKAPSPERRANQTDLIRIVEKAIEEKLTDRQRKALTSVMIAGIPVEVVAEQMGSNRNALYKLMHDARLRLKKALLEEELTPENILATFR